MLLDVRPILYTPGKSLDFRRTLDLSDVTYPRPVTRPVEAEGTVRNRAGVLELTLTARSTLDARCDRCGTPLTLDKAVEYRCLLAQELEDEDNEEIVLLEDGQADVEDLARTAFLLDLDTKVLCREDCKGLCPKCGANLNDGPCGCEKEPDPRWAALGRLLETPMETRED
ncbi:MAG: DUF177 domain-containing protein [Oscillibacter sp.]|nr:DUF177 domain-containing protein [Oscillibacter sp.]